VGFSNPVRQNLYTHADAVAGNRMKATTAAQRLREINPSAVTAGHVLEIPMPGHTIGESLLAQTEDHLQVIQQQVQDHDAIFLLTDSRESRWLPTLLGAANQKVGIYIPSIRDATNICPSRLSSMQLLVLIATW